MKNKILVFEQFLIDNGVNTEYFKEECLKTDDKIKFIFCNKSLSEFLTSNDKSDFIISGFDWSDTKEGSTYWDNLDNTWRALIAKNPDKEIYFGFGIDVCIVNSNKDVTLSQPVREEEASDKIDSFQEHFDIDLGIITKLNIYSTETDTKCVGNYIDYTCNKLNIVIPSSLDKVKRFMIDRRLFDLSDIEFGIEGSDTVLLRKEDKGPTDEIIFKHILSLDYISKVDIYKYIKDKSCLPEAHFLPRDIGYSYLLHLYDELRDKIYVFKPVDLANSEGIFVGTMERLDELLDELSGTDDAESVLSQFNVHYDKDYIKSVVDSFKFNNFIIQEKLSISKEYRVIIFKINDEIIIEERNGYSEFIEDNTVEKTHNVINSRDIDNDVRTFIDKIRTEETDLFNVDLPVLSLDVVKTTDGKIYLIEANSGFGVNYPINVLNRIQKLTSASLYKVILDKFNLGSKEVLEDYCVKNNIDL